MELIVHFVVCLPLLLILTAVYDSTLKENKHTKK